MKKILIYLTVGLIIFFGIASILIHLFFDRITFLPKKLDKDYVFEFDSSFEEFNIHGSKTWKINCLFFPSPKEDRKGLLLYFHGNADNLQRWANYFEDFTSLGYDVMGIDYPGYGKSDGRPTEQFIYESADSAFHWAREHYAIDSIVIYGRSLGCAPASYLNSKYESKLLLLETPFHSLKDLLQVRSTGFYLFKPKYEFPNYKFLQKGRAPCYIIQGTKDRIVPYKSAIKLKPYLNEEEHFLVIDGGKHKNLRTFDQYHSFLQSILLQ